MCYIAPTSTNFNRQKRLSLRKAGNHNLLVARQPGRSIKELKNIYRAMQRIAKPSLRVLVCEGFMLASPSKLK